MSRSHHATGSLGSSPPAGPAGATITVSGSGWPQSDGTQVTFGYLSGSTCAGVPDSQIAVVSGGSFSGWLRWPTGLATGNYTICANIGGSIATAGTFTALSSASPQVALSATSLTAGQHFTITATNYLPSGTVVYFVWASVSHVILSLGNVASDSNGTAAINFVVPTLSLASGQYTIQATGGRGQPAPLFAASSFTYTAPATPTPSPTPSPTQDPTPAHTPTVVVSATATSTATTQQTVLASPTAQGTQTNANSGVPASTATPTGNQVGVTGSGSSNLIYLVGGALGSLVFLLALLFVALRQRSKRTRVQQVLISPDQAQWTGGPFGSAAPSPGMVYPAGQPGEQAWNALPVYSPGAALNPGTGPLTPAPALPVQQAYAPVAGQPGTLYTPLPSVPQAFAGSANQAFDRNSSPPPLPESAFFRPPAPQVIPAGALPGAPEQRLIAMPLDPALETIRRQVQTGLLVDPRSHKTS